MTPEANSDDESRDGQDNTTSPGDVVEGAVTTPDAEPEAEPEAEAAANREPEAEDSAEQLKAKFRAALDAKASNQHLTAESAGAAGLRADGKVVGGRRTFRRRAGGK